MKIRIKQNLQSIVRSLIEYFRPRAISFSFLWSRWMDVGLVALSEGIEGKYRRRGNPNTQFERFRPLKRERTRHRKSFWLPDDLGNEELASS
jgi:hypothetical protein